jgi:flagellar protein FliS
MIPSIIYPRSTRIYREAATQSASPGQLVLMLFDGALRFMEAAATSFDEEDFIRRNERIHNNLTKAQAILTELQATLDLKAGGEFGTTMFRLYDYMQEQLRLANWNKEPQPLHVVQRLLGEVRDAWAQMLEQSSTTRPMEAIGVSC